MDYSFSVLLISLFSWCGGNREGRKLGEWLWGSGVFWVIRQGWKEGVVCGNWALVDVCDYRQSEATLMANIFPLWRGYRTWGNMTCIIFLGERRPFISVSIVRGGTKQKTPSREVAGMPHKHVVILSNKKFRSCETLSTASRVSLESRQNRISFVHSSWMRNGHHDLQVSLVVWAFFGIGLRDQDSAPRRLSPKTTYLTSWCDRTKITQSSTWAATIAMRSSCVH